MNREEFYRMRNDRSLRYAGRVLDAERRIVITADADYLETTAGQAAVLVAVNLLSRMTPSVSLGFGDTRFQPMLQDSPMSLHEFLLGQMKDVDPNGSFNVKGFSDDDYRVHAGPTGAPWIVHGSDWNAFVGEAPSPLASPGTSNPLGGAFAAIMAAAKIFKDAFPGNVAPIAANLLKWTCELAERCPLINTRDSLGNVWFVGAGSVGSAIAYFLVLAGVKFEATIFDGDSVKVENLDRSPIFRYEDVGESKAEVVAKFLRAQGISATAERSWLDRSEKWKQRQQGVPDILISAANERNVRYAIESLLPPVQIYGTTGTNWQACVLRHIPPQDPCTCCMFPPDASAPMKCATGVVDVPVGGSDKTKQIDASLPFLSFAAGLMAAVEIVKLANRIPGTSNRAFFTPCGDPIVYPLSLQRREKCLCMTRSSAAHRTMVSGSKYANLSRF
jgi:hypothetical protein